MASLELFGSDVKAPEYTRLDMAPPVYEQHASRGVLDRTLDLLGSRSTQAVLADAVLTVVLSLYFSIHRLATLTSSHQLSLACARLARAAPGPASAFAADLGPELSHACHLASSTAAAQALLPSPGAVRAFFLVLVVLKAAAVAGCLGAGPRDSSASAARACDFVVTSIALHALVGFSSFLLVPVVPSPRFVLAFAHRFPLSSTLIAALATGSAALALTRAIQARRRASLSRATSV